MPTYQYRCKTCGHNFDVFQKFSEEPLTTCPECGGEVRRVLQPAGIIFKGSGWYIKDSKSGAGSTAGESSVDAAD
jgi:putative FmdB family regulatory protein